MKENQESAQKVQEQSDASEKKQEASTGQSDQESIMQQKELLMKMK